MVSHRLSHRKGRPPRTENGRVGRQILQNLATEKVWAQQFGKSKEEKCVQHPLGFGDLGTSVGLGGRCLYPYRRNSTEITGSVLKAFG